VGIIEGQHVGSLPDCGYGSCRDASAGHSAQC